MTNQAPNYTQMLVTADKNAGGPDERDVLQESLAAGHVYIGDRGYERYMLYQSIKDAGSDYVIRGQDRPVEIVESRTLSTAAQAAHVVSDDEVTLSPNGQRKAVTHRVRRVVIQKRDQGRQQATAKCPSKSCCSRASWTCPPRYWRRSRIIDAQGKANLSVAIDLSKCVHAENAGNRRSARSTHDAFKSTDPTTCVGRPTHGMRTSPIAARQFGQVWGSAIETSSSVASKSGS